MLNHDYLANLPLYWCFMIIFSKFCRTLYWVNNFCITSVKLLTRCLFWRKPLARTQYCIEWHSLYTQAINYCMKRIPLIVSWHFSALVAHNQSPLFNKVNFGELFYFEDVLIFIHPLNCHNPRDELQEIFGPARLHTSK